MEIVLEAGTRIQTCPLPPDISFSAELAEPGSLSAHSKYLG